MVFGLNNFFEQLIEADGFGDRFGEVQGGFIDLSPTAVAPPSNVPLIQTSVFDLQQDQEIDYSTFVDDRPNTPENGESVLLVNSPTLDVAGEGDGPANPPVFFPTLIPPLKDPSLFSEFNSSPVSAEITQGAAGGASSFSNVDLGLIATGGAAVVLTGLIALIRR